MNVVIPPDKAYFRIGEVSRILGVEPSVLRFWESEFKSVRPIRTTAEQRLYRRQDVQELLTIKTLLYEEFFTIKGAKRQLFLRKAGQDPQRTELDIRKKLEEVKEGLAQIQKLLKGG
ncbi:MAG: MerR family regulatory protein [Syntrophus sp. PtaU1.Bin208]|nr:MAG: MerR family regulatory protein [Syntrophus sp. PtaU1.Bin208]